MWIKASSSTKFPSYTEDMGRSIDGELDMGMRLVEVIPRRGVDDLWRAGEDFQRPYDKTAYSGHRQGYPPYIR